jgi:murein DD-endopeptidase MepM/ murein hydrolase activator NlpD
MSKSWIARRRSPVAGALGLLGLLLSVLFGFSHPLAAEPVQRRSLDPAGLDGADPEAAHRVSLAVKKGDTLMAMLQDQGLDPRYCAAVLAAMSGQLNLRLLHPGDQLVLELRTIQKFTVLSNLDFQPRKGEPVAISLPAALRQVRLERHEISGTVGTDLAAALRNAQLPASLRTEVVAAGKYDPDLSGSLKPDSTFDIFYSETRLGDRLLANPALQEIVFTTEALEHRLYLYRDAFDNDALVNARGKGIVWLHLKRPVLNARLSSPFGWRIHPVFGDRRFHDGIDLAIAEGTPVTAAADGVVTDAGWHGNYGQYVRIRHSAGVETTYGHLSRIADGIKPGGRVSVGQVIGAVGETGVATGPHLYFEVSIGGQYVDPLKLPLAVPVRLTANELSHLKKQLAAQD